MPHIITLYDQEPSMSFSTCRSKVYHARILIETNRRSKRQGFWYDGSWTIFVSHTIPIWANSVLSEIQKQSPEVFCKRSFHSNFAKFTGKHLCQSLWNRFFPVNFKKFLRTPFFTEHLWWLVLEIITKSTIFWSL